MLYLPTSAQPLSYATPIARYAKEIGDETRDVEDALPALAVVC
jgi:hypothetical protein